MLAQRGSGGGRTSWVTVAACLEPFRKKSLGVYAVSPTSIDFVCLLSRAVGAGGSGQWLAQSSGSSSYQHKQLSRHSTSGASPHLPSAPQPATSRPLPLSYLQNYPWKGHRSRVTNCFCLSRAFSTRTGRVPGKTGQLVDLPVAS